MREYHEDQSDDDILDLVQPRATVGGLARHAGAWLQRRAWCRSRKQDQRAREAERSAVWYRRAAHALRRREAGATGSYRPSCPVLFLDIDGVLNHAEWDSRNDPAEDPSCAFDPAAVNRLDRILAATVARVVLSSSWRTMFEPRQIAQWLHQRGAVHLDLIDVTPDGATREAGPLWLAVPRGWEIQAWRERNGHVGPFAVLDDTSDMDGVEDHFVPTDYRNGLQDEHVQAAIALLRA